MIEKEKIVQLVNEKLTEDQFLVEVTVSASNVIHVMVDSDNGISINQIVEIVSNFVRLLIMQNRFFVNLFKT